MKKKKVLSRKQDMRRIAEERLKEGGSEIFLPLQEDRKQRLLHELQVHQIELEMQNEQLLQSQEQAKDYMMEILTIYENVPLIMILLNSGLRVCRANNFTAEFAEIDTRKLIGMKFGQALRCLHALDDPQGCGFGTFCTECPVRKKMIYTLDSGLLHNQTEVNFLSTIGEETKESVFLLSCVRMELHSEPMVLVSLVDITDRKKTEEEKEQLMSQLRQAEKMSAIGQLAGGIAHNFNNQLAGIIGFNDLLADSLKEVKLQRYSAGISTCAFRSTELISQLLTFSRKEKCLSAPVNIHMLIGEATLLLANSIDKKISIKQHLASDECTIMGDSGQLENALINLGINASDAMQSGGEILFATKEVELVGEQAAILGVGPGSYLQIEVSDTGVGMSVDTMTHIFEPFFTTKEVGKGTGLGLASAYGCILSHHGAISVESQQGRGTTFYIHLSLINSTVVGDCCG